MGFSSTSQLTFYDSRPRNEVFGMKLRSCWSRVICGTRRVSSSIETGRDGTLPVEQ
jgi:hypothetical protein